MSVHPHSSSDTFFIYCVGQSIPVINAFKVAMAHANITVKPLMGSYKGVTEYSFVSRMNDYPAISAWLDEEESILHIHSFNSRDVPKATLIYLKEGRREDIGHMIAVSREEALAQESWTFDPAYNNYFICKMVE